jgi:hypothetical protein
MKPWPSSQLKENGKKKKRKDELCLDVTNFPLPQAQFWPEYLRRTASQVRGWSAWGCAGCTDFVGGGETESTTVRISVVKPDPDQRDNPKQ